MSFIDPKNLKLRRPAGWDPKAINSSSEWDVYLDGARVATMYDTAQGWSWFLTGDPTRGKQGWGAPDTRELALAQIAARLGDLERERKDERSLHPRTVQATADDVADVARQIDQERRKAKGQHGGARPGAGRPTLRPEQRRVRIDIRLTLDEIEALKALGNGRLTAGVRKALQVAAWSRTLHETTVPAGLDVPPGTPSD